MALSFTGFWEAHGPDIETEMATTVSYVPAPELLRRLRARLETVERGTHLRVDLIAWDGPEDPVDPHKTLMLSDEEIDALWTMLVTVSEGSLVKLRVLDKIQTLVEELR